MEINNKFFVNAEIKDCEIRKIEDKSFTFTRNGKTFETHSLIIAVDVGKECKRIYLQDKNMENLNKYKRGMTGSFIVRLDVYNPFGTDCKMVVVGFSECQPFEAQTVEN